jgi:hypothetical protein
MLDSSLNQNFAMAIAVEMPPSIVQGRLAALQSEFRGIVDRLLNVRLQALNLVVLQALAQDVLGEARDIIGADLRKLRRCRIFEL